MYSPRTYLHFYTVVAYPRAVVPGKKINIAGEGECLAGIHQLVDVCATCGASHGAGSGLLSLLGVVEPLSSCIGQHTADGGGTLGFTGHSLFLGSVTIFITLAYIRCELLFKRCLHKVVVRAKDNHLGKGVVFIAGTSGSGYVLHGGHTRTHTFNSLRT